MNNSHCQKAAFPAFPGSQVGIRPMGRSHRRACPCVLHLEERRAACSGWIRNLRALLEPWKARYGRHWPPISAWAGSCGNWGAGCDEPKCFPALPTQKGQTWLDCGALAVSPIFPLGTAQEEPPGPFALPETFTLTIPHSLRPSSGGQIPSSPLSCFHTKRKPELEAGAARQGQLPSRQVAALLLSKGCATASLCRAFCLHPAACLWPARRR